MPVVIRAVTYVVPARYLVTAMQTIFQAGEVWPVLLSGFPSPVENMPVWLQWVDWFNPLRHLIVIVKGVFLKDIGAPALLHLLWPLAVIAALTLAAANSTFRKRLG